MKIGLVSGNVVSTVNHPFFDGRRLMICDLIGPNGEVDGYTIAVDTVDAGVGDTVLIIDEAHTVAFNQDKRSGRHLRHRL